VNIVLTERDEYLLSWLWQVRYATPRQVHRFIFEDTKRCTATNRLLALQEAGLVKIATKGVYQVADKDRKVVCITRGGVAALNQQRPNNPIRPTDVPKTDAWALSRTGLIHDLRLVDVGISLCETLEDASWTSEHVLRSHIRKNAGSGTRIPDALLSFQVGDEKHSLVLENEYARYSQEKFVKILDKLRWQYPGFIRMFVVADMSHLAHLLHWASTTGYANYSSEMLVFGHYPDVVENGANATWIHVGGEISPDHILRQACTGSCDNEDIEDGDGREDDGQSPTD